MDAEDATPIDIGTADISPDNDAVGDALDAPAAADAVEEGTVDGAFADAPDYDAPPTAPPLFATCTFSSRANSTPLTIAEVVQRSLGGPGCTCSYGVRFVPGRVLCGTWPGGFISTYTSSCGNPPPPPDLPHLVLVFPNVCGGGGAHPASVASDSDWDELVAEQIEGHRDAGTAPDAPSD
ncbi:MAG: hypothetical protein ABW133_12490 [Polyangiaceae bacterium]